MMGTDVSQHHYQKHDYQRFKKHNFLLLIYDYFECHAYQKNGIFHILKIKFHFLRCPHIKEASSTLERKKLTVKPYLL